METPPAPETPSSVNNPVCNTSILRQELIKRGRQTQKRAYLYLLFSIITLFLGITGIIFAPDLIKRDQSRLQSETVRNSIASNLEKINVISAKLVELEKLEDIPALLGIDITPDSRIGVAVGANGTILTTQDGGTTWNKGESGTEENLLHIALDADGQKGITVGANGTILITQDGGTTWNKGESGTTKHLGDVAFDADGQGIAVGANGTILITQDGGITWNEANSGTKERLRHIALDADGQKGITVGANGTILTTQDGGITWNEVESGTEEILTDIFLNANGQRGIAIGGRGTMLMTSDGGITWDKVESGTTQSLRHIDLDTNGQKGIIVAEHNIILRTQDGGITWNEVYRSAKSHTDLWNIALDNDGQRGIIVGYKGTILTTEDSGLTWTYYETTRKENRRNLLVDRNRLVQENRNLEIGLITTPSDQHMNIDERITTNTWNYLTLTASWRLPFLVLSLFLIQVLVGLNRYNTRLAAFYFARADALSLLNTETNSASLETLERATWILSPDQVDFGKGPQAMSQQAMDLIRNMLTGRGTQNRNT